MSDKEFDDSTLLELAVARLAKIDSNTFISAEEVDAQLGITVEDLADFEEVQIN